MGSEVIVVLSLLSGYVFIHSVHFLRYRSQSLNGSRLLFETAAAGLPFLIFARLLLLFMPQRGNARAWWGSIAGEIPWSATILLALVSGLALAFLSNVLVGFFVRGNMANAEPVTLPGVLSASRRFSLDRAVDRYGNALQKAQHAAATRWDEGLLIEVTLACRRVYVGFVVESPALTANDGYLELLAVMSGHRRADDLRTVYDHSYMVDEAHAQQDDGLTVRVVLPLAEIQVLRILDLSDVRSLDRQLEAEAGSTHDSATGHHDSRVDPAPDGEVEQDRPGSGDAPA